ncbi:MAG: efflux RND transporter permease subunit [Spirochaetaceae bacterium]|nr:MAG: efflux RND transporter permease subunit [Spirochaetaceae bacterium]
MEDRPQSDRRPESVNRLISWTLSHPVAVLSTTALILILAALSIQDMPVSFMPEVDVPAFVVRTEFPGLPAAEIIDLLTIPVERALSGVSSVSSLISTSRSGVSAVEVRFHPGTVREHALADVRQSVDSAYRALPDGVERPSVLSIPVFREPSAVIAVIPRSVDLAAARDRADRGIRSALQQIDGTGTIVVRGGDREEIHVRADPARLAATGTAFGMIRKTLQSSVFEYSAGSIQTAEREMRVLTDASVDSSGALGQLVLTGGLEAYPLVLGDVADVAAGTAQRTVLFSYLGREAVGIAVYARPGRSPAQVADRVRAFLTDYNRRDNRDVHLVLAFDGAEALRTALRDLLIAAVLGSFCAFCVIKLFVRSSGPAFAVFCSIPITMAIAILTMQQLGLGINLMSLSGLAVAVGMIVDSSIVVADSLDLNPEQPAAAVTEVAFAGLSGTATTAVVFLPLVGLPGVLGDVYRDLVISVVITLIASYAVSIIVVPTIWTALKSSSRHSPSAVRWIEDMAVRTGGVSLLPASFVFACITLSLSGALSLPFAPTESLDSGVITVHTGIGANSSFRVLQERTRVIENVLTAHDAVLDVNSTSGGEIDDPMFLVSIDHEPGEIRSTVRLQPGRSSFVVAKELSDILEQAAIPARVLIPPSPLAHIVRGELGRGEPVRAQSFAEAHAAALRVLVENNPGVPETGLAAAIVPAVRVESVYLRPRMSVLHRYGLSSVDLTRLIYAGTTGLIAGRIGRPGNERDVRLLYGGAPQLTALSDLQIVGAAGELVPLHILADIEHEEAPATSLRIDQLDAVIMQAGHGPRVPDPVLPDRDMQRLSAVFAISVAVLFLVLILHFDAIFPACAILLMLPFSWAGALLALNIAGRTLTLESAVGLLVLTGLTVNPGIILIETYDALRKTGAGVTETLQTGTARRIRPVLMTGITTIIALFPLAVDPGLRSVQSNAATVIIGGVLSGTIATLVMIPALYRWSVRERPR